MSGGFSAQLEHEHARIDAGIEAYLAPAGRPGTAQRDEAAHAIRLLRRHIYFEEAFLFPPLRALGLAGPVSVMVHEHGAMWTALDRIEPRITDRSPATDTRTLCAELLDQLASHNWKEETIVYAQALERLPSADQIELHRLLDRTEVPDGWRSGGCREA